MNNDIKVLLIISSIVISIMTCFLYVSNHYSYKAFCKAFPNEKISEFEYFLIKGHYRKLD